MAQIKHYFYSRRIILKILLIGMLVLGSISSYSADDCKIAFEGGVTPLSNEHSQIIKNYLKDRSTNDESEADYKLIVNASSETVFDSVWSATGYLVNLKGGSSVYTISGTDYRASLPIHMATLGVGTMIATNGNIALGRMAKKIPTCDELNELLKD